MIELKSFITDSNLFAPSQEFKKNANLTIDMYNTLVKKSQDDYLGFWEDLAKKHISWQKPFTKVFNENDPQFFKWFEDGELNVSYNCLDRHVVNHPEKTALIFESDSGHKVFKITYAELLSKVCCFANGLKSIGVKKGDRVIIYMPHSIEAVIAMQACVRIGVIHSVVFAGFSSKSLGERIQDVGAEYLITADGLHRGGKILPIKNEVNLALESLGSNNPIKYVIVDQRSKQVDDLIEGQDILWGDLIAGQDDFCEPEIMNSEDILFILYTSGSTGKPKGIQHSCAGYLLGVIVSLLWVFDYKPNDIFWCTADIGWITGHSYVCYGPLAVGATQVIFEGIPTYPNSSRFWAIIQAYKVTTFYTAPTAIRALMKSGVDLPKQYDLSSLRLLGSVGEPINPKAWMWFYKVVGKKRCPIVDTWWQTETGSNMLAPIPGVISLKPGSCTFPLPGIIAAVIDEEGNELGNNETGYLVIKKPFPSQLRNIWQNPVRYINSYFPAEIGHGKYYVAGDRVHKDKDGYFWILGRVDDVLNVSGHRLSTMEIESVLAAHSIVAEAAVVSKPHEIKGESVCAFVVCKGSRPLGAVAIKLETELREWVGHEIGAIAKPDEIHFGDNLPKTRSGKIMRRLLRSIAKGEEITQDTSTLESSAVLEQLK